MVRTDIVGVSWSSGPESSVVRRAVGTLPARPSRDHVTAWVLRDKLRYLGSADSLGYYEPVLEDMWVV